MPMKIQLLLQLLLKNSLNKNTYIWLLHKMIMMIIKLSKKIQGTVFLLPEEKQPWTEGDNKLEGCGE